MIKATCEGVEHRAREAAGAGGDLELECGRGGGAGRQEGARQSSERGAEAEGELGGHSQLCDHKFNFITQ